MPRKKTPKNVVAPVEPGAVAVEPVEPDAVAVELKIEPDAVEPGECACGSSVSRKNMAKHLKTKKHVKFLNQ
jgi:hypothetical protein